MRGRVRIFDTSLRDGEQAPGCTMTLPEKLKVAEQLARLGVDVIEAGFPAASAGEVDAVSAVAQRVGSARGPIVCGLARTAERDIATCAAAIRDASRRRIHTFIATSDIHLKHKLRLTREEVLRRAADAVTLARTFVDDVEFSPEDAGRSDWGFVSEVLAAVIEAGATTLNIPDTVGYLTPAEYGFLIERVVAQASKHPGVVVSTHCHDDLGMAVANSLAGVRAGARQVECTVNGIGERAGNASLEEVVMAIATRPDYFSVDTGIATQEIARTSRLVSACTGVYVPPNKAVVGSNAFAHEAGIHQDGVIKHRATYEIMTAESVGGDGSLLVLGKHSGRAALRKRLCELGIELDDEPFRAVFDRFKALADRKKVLDDRDLRALAGGAPEGSSGRYELDQAQVTCGTHTIPTATVRMRCPDGSLATASGTGDGPVDAVCRAVNGVLGELGQLCEFQVHAVTEGIDAVGRVTVRVRDFHTGVVYLGHGVQADIVTASAEAYVSALNHLLAARDAAAGSSQAPGLRPGSASPGVSPANPGREPGAPGVPAPAAAP
ncbi:MAG: 2-isopropylmalate synthase [Gemmatimonadetes bacterium]|nr:2-isopropylmalate synthase [Gemmatimonadota bacterium]